MAATADAGLRLRMAGTLALTATVALAGAATVYAAGLALFHLVARWSAAGPDATRLASPLAAAGAVAFLCGVVYLELRVDRDGLPAVEASRATPEAHPELLGAVDRAARQFGCERPTVAVTDDPAPLAMTTGLTAGSSTLVVSTGLLEALDAEKLEAVVAHELAHVANRDAAVMTAAALPMVVADRVKEWAVAEDDLSAGDAYAEAGGEANPVVYPVAALFWFVGRLLVTRLSRYRELAADRAAAVATGSPAALAAALRTIDEGDRPYRDGRSAVGAFAIVPAAPPEPVRLGPEGRQPRAFAGLRRWMRRVFRTHPPLERRLAELEGITERMERA